MPPRPSPQSQATFLRRENEATAVPKRWWFQPAFFIMVPVTASFTAWLAMVAWHKYGQTTASWAKLSGFAIAEPLTAKGIVLLTVWYGAVVSIATLGWRLGVDKKPKPERVERFTTPAFERRYFTLIMIASVVGIAYSYYKIGSAQSIIGSLTTQENQFTNSVPAYAGVQTLRSATILAAPVGIYLWRKKLIALPYMVAGVVLLLLNSMIASRLSLFMAGVVYLVIWLKSQKPAARLKPVNSRRLIAALALVVVAFGVLAGLNFVRNALYYKAAGVTNPIVMNFYQLGAYLGTPAQVSAGVSDAVMRSIWDRPGDPIGSSDAAKPTFLQFSKVAKADDLRDADFYGYAVVVEENFTTNSVFADTYAIWGMWGWAWTMTLSGLAGYVFARFLRYGVVVGGSAGVMAHCLSETWRTQNVNYGFVIFLMLLTVMSAYVAVRWCRWDDRRATRKALRQHTAVVRGAPTAAPPGDRPPG